ncbi:MAG: hypothetical protein H0X66_16045 [Verrucomicrobia bacterium]|nr:hypothetical protein [Verrucomicrobiota bacterium]
MNHRSPALLLTALLACACAFPEMAISAPQQRAQPVYWDTFSDTWVATDALGRSVPTHAEVGPLRRDKTVGIFYFLWLRGDRSGGPYDVADILRKDPAAMQKPDSPLWGPLHAPHHWDESIFGHYVVDDPGVLRKHAQMLSDAGVDAIFFDVSNQLTYQPQYMELLRVFSEFKQQGGRPPQIAFICPFWNPAKVVNELYRDLYEPGLYSDLWFRWEGKPLILADPQLLDIHSGQERRQTPTALLPGQTLGQSFTVTTNGLEKVGACVPTWHSTGSVTLSLYREGPGGARIASRRFEGVEDNEWISLELNPVLAPGVYYLEMSEPEGKAGWWSHPDNVLPQGTAFADAEPAPGVRTIRLVYFSERTQQVRDFFSFRKPQPDYFKGQKQPNMWSWLEVYPQTVFTNTSGVREQMSVGVGQNAVDGRLGSMSEPGAHGRSFHKGATDPRPDAVLHGYNLAEQWEHALKEDPQFVFITGWNEWIAGRHDEFNGIRLPVMFVDQFDQEHSRDIEPMKGGHGDNYYYQMASYIRRYKGARAIPTVSQRPIKVDGRFNDWKAVQPEFRDTQHDPMRRDYRGWDPNVIYTNDTGRNDFVVMKASYDSRNLYFYARTREPLTSFTDPHWMLLFIDADADPKTGWLGYDFVVNRSQVGARTTTLERNVQGEYRWSLPVEISYRAVGNELELAIPLSALGLKTIPAHLDFKWADNIQQTGDWSDFTLNGDVAPNDRFNYRAVFKPGI